MKAAIRLCLFVVTLLTLPSLVSAATYYARTGGNDVNTCTQAQTDNDANAKASVKSVILCATGGDTVYIHTGTYTQTGTSVNVWPTGGTAGNRILISAFTGETVTITCDIATFTVASNCLDFAGDAESYITIQNFILDAGGGPNPPSTTLARAVVKAQYIGTDKANQAHDIWVIGNEIRNGLQGVLGGSEASEHQGWLIKNNWVHHNGNGESNQTHNVYIRGQNNTVEYNKVENGGASGIHVWLTSGSVSNNANTIVRYNTLTLNQNLPSGSTPTITVGQSASAKIYGNTIWNSDDVASPAIRCFGSTQNCEIWNNSIHHVRPNAIEVSAGATGAIIRNNILLGWTSAAILDNGTGTIQSNNLTTDPGVVNAVGGDFTLLSTASAAINSGLVNATYCAEPTGLTCDIGAHQTFGTLLGTCSANSFFVTLPHKFLPVSPSTGITGWAGAEVAAGARTITAVTRSTDTQYTLTISGAAITAGQSCTVDYAPGNVVACEQIGRGNGAACTGKQQPLFTRTDLTLTNTTGGTSPTYTQGVTRFQLHNDSIPASTTDAKWLFAENADITLTAGSTVRVYVGTRVTVANAANQEYRVQIRKNAGSWVDLTDTCGDACLETDTVVVNLAALGDVLSLGGSTYCCGSYSESPLATSPVHTVLSGQQLNRGVVLKLSSALVANDTIDVRIQPQDGVTVTLTQIPTITIGSVTAWTR